MMIADVLLAAGMGSAGALRAAASQADCSRKRRSRFFARQSPGLAQERAPEFASFFLNFSQGKALFTPTSGAAHNFRRYLPVGLRMPDSAGGQSVVIHRRRKTDGWPKIRTRFASRSRTFGLHARSAEREMMRLACCVTPDKSALRRRGSQRLHSRSGHGVTVAVLAHLLL